MAGNAKPPHDGGVVSAPAARTIGEGVSETILPASQLAKVPTDEASVTVIVLLGDLAPYLAGKVLRADADVIARLDRSGVAWREATRTEQDIAAI